MNIKKYKYFIKIFLLDYKSILINFAFTLGIFILMISIGKYFANRQYLVEKFNIGIVINDDEKYISLILDILNSHDDFVNSFNILKVSEDEGKIMLEENEIPCYIVIPINFTNSIINGENLDIKLVGNKDDSLRYGLSKALVKAGTAFISSSQSGIYSTIEFARENNINENVINNEIINKINLDFGKALLGYKNYYEVINLYPSGALDLKTHYLYSFMILFLIIFGINFYDSVNRFLNVSDKFITIGISNVKLICYMTLSLFTILTFFSMGIIIMFGIVNIVLVLNVSILIVFSGIVFKDKVSSGIFVLSTSLFMLIVSGGIIPKGLLPKFISNLSFLSLNDYFLMSKPFSEILIYTLTFSGILILISLRVIKNR